MNAAIPEPREPPPLGRWTRPLWMLREDGTFLNHGSYGANPRVVQEEHNRLRVQMEQHPDAFIARIQPIAGSERALRKVAGTLAAFTGTSGERIALVENTTTGVQAVLNSLPFGPGDEILITDHQYNAVRLAVEARCRDTGASPRVVRIPLPTSADEILARVLDAARAPVKLAILDHLSSSTALLFPVEQLVPELRRRGIPVFIDGAHAIGQVPLALDALQADWYITNMHKWAYAPRGSAMLYASRGAAPLTRPVLTSHYIEMGFPHSFDYVGTRDYSAWLAVPRALAFLQELGIERLRDHNMRIVRTGSAALLAAGAVEIAPLAMSAAMRAFHLPQCRPATDADALAVIRDLWEQERIQIRCARLGGMLLLRFCAQAYVDDSDVQRLGEALQRRGWPARR